MFFIDELFAEIIYFKKQLSTHEYISTHSTLRSLFRRDAVYLTLQSVDPIAPSSTYLFSISVDITEKPCADVLSRLYRCSAVGQFDLTL